jgi:uncharacterized membrane protein YdjX (TVP38/TMEM64 family)
MEKVDQRSVISRKKGVIKASLLVAFLLAAIIVIRFTPVKDFLKQESLARFLNAAGFWAPLVFILVYIVRICLFVPGTLLTALGAAIFGAYWGFLYVWIGAMAGASAAF